VWKELADARDAGEPCPTSVGTLGALCGSASYVPHPPDLGVWPTPKPSPAPSGAAKASAASIPRAVLRRIWRAVKQRL
jgi:hypothetical protein